MALIAAAREEKHKPDSGDLLPLATGSAGQEFCNVPSKGPDSVYTGIGAERDWTTSWIRERGCCERLSRGVSRDDRADSSALEGVPEVSPVERVNYLLRLLAVCE
jgi:hypothetical protein